MDARTCLHCNGPMPADAWPTAKFCGQTCRNRAFNARRKADGRRAALDERLREQKAEYMKANRDKYNTRHCVECGQSYAFPGGGGRTCPPCRELIAAQKRAKASEARRANKAAEAAGRKQPAPRTWYSGTCRQCGAWFTHNQPHTNTCSRRCCDKLHKVKAAEARGRFRITDQRRAAIYERDAWTCQLCGEHVDASLHYLDDMAASLDHIEPQALALVPDHTDRNLRLAHRICNSRRGAPMVAA